VERCGEAVPRDLRQRTAAFAVDVVRLVERLPRSRTTDVLSRQLLRAGTSVAANYRAACRARSRREFIARLGIVEEEADEAMFWIGLLQETGHADRVHAAAIRQEAGELVAIIVASIRTARRGHSAFHNPHSALISSRAAPAAPRSTVRVPR